MLAAEQQYLIIGGQPKAGTTSLYDWLSKHPDITPSRIKEARFFLDPDYPLPTTTRYDGSNLEDYTSLFQAGGAGQGKIRMEATPDYLYNKTALKIATALPKARIVFVVREPVERMVSWYKFALQRGFLQSDVDFKSYILQQIETPVSAATPMHLRALDQCRSDASLKPFMDAFEGRCLVLDFQKLRENPAGIMEEICAFANIPFTPYVGFSFEAQNASTGSTATKLEAMYYRTRSRITYRLNSSRGLRKALQPINKLVKKMLIKSGDANPQKVAISVDTEVREMIYAYLNDSKIPKMRLYVTSNQ